MANWSLPTVNDLRAAVLSILKERDDELAKMFDGVSPTNLPTNAIRWNSTTNRFEKWNGSSWVVLTSSYAIDVSTVAGYAPAAAATANTLALRDASGRMKAAAPSATDDVLRLLEMNNHKTAATLDHPDASVTTVKIADLNVTAGKLAAGAAVSNIGYTPINKAGDDMNGGLTLKQGTDVASAATLNPGNGGNYFVVTGTTGITAISTTAKSPLLLRFAGALTLTNGANLVLRGGANITTVAGDIAEFRLEAPSTWRMTYYSRATGLPVRQGTGSGLDADTLRGFSDYYRPGSSIDATTLSGQNQAFYFTPFRNYQLYTTPGSTSFVVPTGVTKIYAKLQAPGGAGGASGNPGTAGTAAQILRGAAVLMSAAAGTGGSGGSTVGLGGTAVTGANFYKPGKDATSSTNGPGGAAALEDHLVRPGGVVYDGRGGNPNPTTGRGGGSGLYCEDMITVTPGESLTVTVGTPGVKTAGTAFDGIGGYILIWY